MHVVLRTFMIAKLKVVPIMRRVGFPQFSFFVCCLPAAAAVYLSYTRIYDICISYFYRLPTTSVELAMRKKKKSIYLYIYCMHSNTYIHIYHCSSVFDI